VLCLDVLARYGANIAEDVQFMYRLRIAMTLAGGYDTQGRHLASVVRQEVSERDGGAASCVANRGRRSSTLPGRRRIRPISGSYAGTAPGGSQRPTSSRCRLSTRCTRRRSGFGYTLPNGYAHATVLTGRRHGASGASNGLRRSRRTYEGPTRSAGAGAPSLRSTDSQLLTLTLWTPPCGTLVSTSERDFAWLRTCVRTLRRRVRKCDFARRTRVRMCRRPGRRCAPCCGGCR
jgi:hypothetical protein